MCPSVRALLTLNSVDGVRGDGGLYFLYVGFRVSRVRAISVVVVEEFWGISSVSSTARSSAQVLTRYMVGLVRRLAIEGFNGASVAGPGLVGGACSAASVNFSSYVKLPHYWHDDCKLVHALAFDAQQFHIIPVK